MLYGFHARPAPPLQLRARYERALSADPHIGKLLDQACCFLFFFCFFFVFFRFLRFLPLFFTPIGMTSASVLSEQYRPPADVVICCSNCNMLRVIVYAKRRPNRRTRLALRIVMVNASLRVIVLFCRARETCSLASCRALCI